VLTLPSSLQAVLDDPEPDDRRGWIRGLPDTLDLLARRWSLRLGEPYQPGGLASWVAPVTGPDGRELVLKAGWVHEEARDEAAGLRVWDGAGTVQLYDDHLVGETSALLLERCDPGTALRDVVPPEQQDVVVAGLLTRLWRAHTAGPFRPLAHMCDFWAEGYEAGSSAAGPGQRLDPGLARAGLALWRELPRDAASGSVLLATDLHAGNILAAQREPWLVIDPKPYVGDPAYDVLQHLLNGDLASDPGGRCDRMADLLGLDRTRVRRWLFARCVVESLERTELHPVALALAPA
jgi:streptomycin 6-kinase